MPDVKFWQSRFQDLGVHSVGPGDTQSEEALEAHRQIFLKGIHHLLTTLKGPALDFGCGTGRWVMDLPRPYLGLDLTPDHIEFCKKKFIGEQDVDFQLSEQLKNIPSGQFSSILTVTVLQHIVESDVRMEILNQFQRILTKDGVFLAVEWSHGQREFDWCTALQKKELQRNFKVKHTGEVVEMGRRHTIWICSPKRNLFSFFNQ